MTLVDRSLRRQFTAAMALAMALALLLSGTALAQTPDAVDIGPACDGAPDAGFPDVSGNTHEEAINCIAWYEITKGTSDGDYEPDRGVTRWQMALFIFRTADYMEEFVGKTLPTPSDQGFEDIDGQSQEAQDAINVLAEINVVKGKTSTSYEPAPVVRRDQMASFINRLQEWATGNTHEGPSEGDGTSAQAFGYPDVPRDNVHGTNIEDLTAAGIVQGFNDGTYRPAQGVDRDQMASFIARHLAVNVNEGTIEPKDGAVSGGEVTLDSDQAEAGGSVNGTVENPGTVESIAVSGCGFNNDDVELDGDGGFSLTIPSGQEPGTCELRFSVRRTDGSTTETVVPFTVTATQQSFTDAPDLVSATANGDVVTYRFDENANGATPVVDNFRIYDADGNSAIPTNVEISGSDPRNILADYDGAALVEAADATVATILDDAVEDGAGNTAYASAAALLSQTKAAGVTDAPDLQTVDNVRVDGVTGLTVADFTFDEQVDQGILPIGPGGFELYTNDGTTYVGQDLEATSANDRTLTVSFLSAALEPPPAGSVTRGAVLAGTVADEDGNDNPQQTEPVEGGAFTADRTVTPDLVSVKVAGTDTVAYEFDEAVSAPGVGDQLLFNLYDSDGVEINGATTVERSGTNPNVINATFDMSDVSGAVGASVDDGAVAATGDGDANLIHELPLQDVAFTAGRTALPDLASVDIAFDEFGDPTVTFTFDEDVPAAGTDAADFALVDETGTVFEATAVADDDGDEVVEATFTSDQAAVAIIASVHDVAGTVGLANLHAFPEGDVTVSRDTSS